MFVVTWDGVARSEGILEPIGGSVSGGRNDIMLCMAKWFNIGGPCNPAKNYMLSATERLPEVVPLINAGAMRSCKLQ